MAGITFASSDTSSELDELLPSREDIPGQFRNVNYKNEILNENGFLEGRSNSYDRTFDGYVILSLRFKVYKFTNSQTATAYLNKKINEIEQQDNYLEVEIPSAFAFIDEDGLAETGNSWSVHDNLVFNVEVYNDWDEDTEDMLITYTLLELDIIPEFPVWIISPLFLITTFLAIIIKKKLLQSTILN
jgi:hypothetical protein